MIIKWSAGSYLENWKSFLDYMLPICWRWKGLYYSWSVIYHAIVRFSHSASRFILIRSAFSQKLYLIFGVMNQRNDHWDPRLHHGFRVREELLFPEKIDSDSVSYFGQLMIINTWRIFALKQFLLAGIFSGSSIGEASSI